MHDKHDTKLRFQRIFKGLPFLIKLSFFYPRDHYQRKQVPSEVSRLARPLNLERISTFDGFIITGAPIERLKFEQVTYIKEIYRLLDKLDKFHVEQLYFCWGAMAAMNYFYGIEKKMLPHKLFGVFPQEILQPNYLLTKLHSEFMAPHARYAEMDQEEIIHDPQLIINARAKNGALFLVSDRSHPERTFLFSHLEYGRRALLKEYEREIAAHPERHYRNPENYFLDPQNLRQPIFSWQQTQRIFFANWLTCLKQRQVKKENIQGGKNESNLSFNY